jgi:prolyl 4-hydroxylase
VRAVRLSDSPAVFAIDGFLSLAEREALEDRGGDWARIAAAGSKHDATGFSWELPIVGDALVEAVCARVDAAVGLSDAFHDTLRFRRYSPGEGHPAHLDHYRAIGHSLVLTAMLVLEAPRAGGETVFPHATGGPLAVVPVPGRLVWWWNVRADGRPDPASLHLGDGVRRGQKVTLTRFVYRPEGEALPLP